MQKALSQMNLKLHHVLSDITGTSGQAILDAILSGQRDPVALAQLCHSRVKSPRDKVAQALVGDYRPEHLFALKQSLEGYRYYQKLILELDQETARLMQALPSATEHPMPPRTKATAYHPQGNDPRFCGVSFTACRSHRHPRSQRSHCASCTDRDRHRC
jgi:transposase